MPIALLVDCGNDPNAKNSYITSMFERMFCDRSGNLIYGVEKKERGLEQDYYVFNVVFNYAPPELKQLCEDIQTNDGVIDWSYVFTGKTTNIYTWKIAEIEI